MPVSSTNISSIRNGTPFNFIDLCAGIGGFHQAMKRLGGICIGASEIDEACKETYSKNFPDTPMLGDLTCLSHSNDIKEFKVLCAGFPCQPFSKAGKRLGFKDESRGKLFFEIMSILDSHPETEFLLLENVRNLADQEDYWNTICKELHKRHFIITDEPLILSPTDFGIPQVRERVFILGIRSSLSKKSKPRIKTITKDMLGLRLKKCRHEQAFEILDSNVDEKYYVNDELQKVLLAWDEFRETTDVNSLSCPVWLCAMGIGEEDTGSFFFQSNFDEMPKWKQRFYQKNREFYLINKEFIDRWVDYYDMKTKIKLYQKFEWNCGNDVNDIKHGIIQIRQSGVRVKRPNYFPALVAMNNTPIIWDSKRDKFRKITPNEAARLQSFDEDFQFCGREGQQYKQLGNAINVEIAFQLGKGLFNLRKGNFDDQET